MSELGERLELPDGGRRRCGTVRLQAREWRHNCVELGSETIEAEELVELGLVLDPAPTERPPLLR